MWYKVVNRHVGPFRDNSRNLAVRMNEDDYQRFQRYVTATALYSTTYFRKLIAGERITVRPDENIRGLHTANGMIHSNVEQILRAAKWAGCADTETLQALEYFLTALSREVSALAFLE